MRWRWHARALAGVAVALFFMVSNAVLYLAINRLSRPVDIYAPPPTLPRSHGATGDMPWDPAAPAAEDQDLEVSERGMDTRVPAPLATAPRHQPAGEEDRAGLPPLKRMDLQDLASAHADVLHRAPADAALVAAAARGMPEWDGAGETPRDTARVHSGPRQVYHWQNLSVVEPDSAPAARACHTLLHIDQYVYLVGVPTSPTRQMVLA